MTAYLKKNKVNIYLLFVIAGVVSLPIVPDGKAALMNVATAVVAFGCFGRMFGNQTVGLIGSMLYTWCPYRCADGNPAWIFVPIVLWGMISLYDAEGYEKDAKRSWLILAVGLGLLSFVSVTVFCVSAGAAVLFFCLMGKNSFCKERLLAVGKTIIVTLLMSGYPLATRLLQLRDPVLTGSLIPENFRMSGAYPAQYLGLFTTVNEGVKYPEVGMGAAVLLLIFLYIWSLFVGKVTDSFGKKILLWMLLLLWLGSNLFPWDLLQNKNMLFSMVLALLQSPLNWLIPAYVGGVWIACRMLQKAAESGEERLYNGLVAATVLVAFVMNQLA